MSAADSIEHSVLSDLLVTPDGSLGESTLSAVSAVEVRSTTARSLVGSGSE